MMKKDHIAFVSFPHPPHVNPTLPLVSAFVRRGYRVTYATSDQFTSRITSLGAEVVPCPAYRMSAVSELLNEDRRYKHPFCRLAVRTLAEIVPFYEKNRPDLVVYDLLAFSGRILAKNAGVPAVQTSPTFAHDKYAWTQQVPDSEMREGLLEASAQADDFFRQYGIVDSDFIFHREGLNVYLFPKVLQPPGDVFGSDIFYAGRCAGEQPYYGDWEVMNAIELPILLVGTSTTYLRGPDYFRTCIDAFAGLQWHVILSIGDACDAASLQPLPPNFEIVRNTSHLSILRYTSLYVCLGGIVSTAEAMYHGVPLIVTTHGAGELEWQAENVERLGIGIHLRKKDTNAEHLRQAVLRISEDRSLLKRVKDVQRIVQREPGAEETANRMEEYLEFCRVSGKGIHSGTRPDLSTTP